MARPYLGNAYGNTDRSTPARLLGGMPESSSQAPIGTDGLAAPALQAVNQLVETFSPVTRSSMPGAVQLPTPPGVPQAQAPVLSRLPGMMTPPNPVVQQDWVQSTNYAPYVDNMGAMARSLSGFSTFFDKLQKFADTREEVADKRAKAEGGALAMEASQVGTFTSLQELQKRLEKGVAEGRPGYSDMLRRFQAADPRALRYATIGLQDAYIKNNAATLAERVSQTKTLLDGRPLESVPANDPEYQRMMSALMFPQGTQGILPEVWAANQQQVGATYGVTSAAQEKRYGSYKTQKAKEGLNATVDANAASLVNGSTPFEQVAANLTNALDGFYNGSGQTSEEYRNELSNLAQGFIQSALGVAGADWSKAKQGLSSIPLALSQVRVGPAQDGDKRPYLLDVIQVGPEKLSGSAALTWLMQDAQEKVLKQQGLQDRMEGREASEQVDADIQGAFTPDVLADPARIDATENALLARGRQLYANNPEMALAYEERVKKHTAGVRGGYVQPIQEQNEVNLWAEMAQNPGQDFTEKIMQLQQAQQISYQAAKGFLQAQSSRNREDNKANYQVLRGLQDDLKKRLEAQYARGNSEGGANLTPNEARQMWGMLGELYRSGDEMIRKAPGQDLTQQLGGMYGSALEKSLPQQQSQAPATATPEAIAKGLAGGPRGNPQQNAQLRRQAETRPLYGKDRMGQQLDQVLSGKPLDEATRQIIRRTGMKPSEFFTKQMQLQGIEMDADTRKRLQELDGGDLVSQAGGTGGFGMLPVNRYQAVAQRLGQQFASAIANGFIPPAAAAPMPMGTAGRGSRPFTGDTGSNQVAARMLPPQTRALLRTIRFAEGTAHQDGYRTMFTGAKFNDLSRHPRRVNRGGGFASDAAGAYQFLSTTWDSVSGGAMTPVRQDLAAVKLVSARGVDPNLPKGFTVQVADRLAPEWASFPTAKTGTSYYGQGGKSYAQLKAYYDRVLREEMARRP